MNMGRGTVRIDQQAQADGGTEKELCALTVGSNRVCYTGSAAPRVCYHPQMERMNLYLEE